MGLSRETLENLISGMADELKTNKELFQNVPPERLAHIASGMFSLCTRLASLTDAGTRSLAATGILYDANSLVKAYNHDKDLKINV